MGGRQPADSRRRGRRSVDDYRHEQEERTLRILHILAGDPTVTDPKDPDNYHNSLVGRIDRVAASTEELDTRTGVAITKVSESVAGVGNRLAEVERKFEQDIKALRDDMRANTVGWHSLRPLVEKNWKLILILLALGVLYARENGMLRWIANA